MSSALTHLECSRCGRTYDADAVQRVCPADGGPLLARYDLERAARTMTRASLGGREPSLWRYEELLPLRAPAERVSLGESITPLVACTKLGPALGLERLWIKDDGALPTGSFKARGAAVGVSRARELGVRALAMPTNGNAGGAWSAYSARAGIEATVVMPKDAPQINRLECVLTGAHVYLVDGLISDAGKIVAAAIEERGWYDASTLKEPYRIEGKKTIGLELVEQFAWDVPDVILYPTGGGVGLIGIAKALRELQAMGLLGARMPRFVAVQAEGCAPIVEAFAKRERESTMWPDARTLAFGITVPKALGDFLVLDALYETNGTAVAVGDEAILAMQREIATREGLLVAPEGAATLVAAQRLATDGWIAPDERVVAINTGTGLKYGDVPYPAPPLLAKTDRLP